MPYTPWAVLSPLLATFLTAASTLAAPPVSAGPWRSTAVPTGRRSVVVQSRPDRYPIIGDRRAPLNIIVWVEFRNDYARRALPYLKQLLRQYKGQVRLQFMNHIRNYVTSWYQPARYAAQVGREAFAQGGHRLYWRYFQSILALPNMSQLSVAHVDSVARRLGMNISRLKRAIRTKRHDAAIQQEVELAHQVGIRPYQTYPMALVGSTKASMTFYRAYYFQQFLATVKTALAQAQRRRKAGVSVAKLHAEQLARAKRAYSGSSTRPRQTAYRRRKRYSIPTLHSPALGDPNATVTVHAFIDFTHYYTSRVISTLLVAQKRHPKRVRVVVKFAPYSSGNSRAIAAFAAGLAAHAQGKFWSVAPLLSQYRGYMYSSRLTALIQQHRLDGPRFRRDMNSARTRAKVLADERLARKVGATSPPAVYIDGERVSYNGMRHQDFDKALKRALRGGLLGRLFSSGRKDP